MAKQRNNAMSNIERMRRNTSQTWRVHLTCGHDVVVSNDDVNRLQWYIGRRVKCPECKESQ